MIILVPFTFLGGIFLGVHIAQHGWDPERLRLFETASGFFIGWKESEEDDSRWLANTPSVEKLRAAGNAAYERLSRLLQPRAEASQPHELGVYRIVPLPLPPIDDSGQSSSVHAVPSVILAVDRSRFCYIQDWNPLSAYMVSTSPVKPVMIPSSLDATRFCVVVSPELSFQCPLEKMWSPPPLPQPPQSGSVRSMLPAVYMAAGCIASISIVLSYFHCHAPLTRIVGVLRLVSPPPQVHVDMVDARPIVVDAQPVVAVEDLASRVLPPPPTASDGQQALAEVDLLLPMNLEIGSLEAEAQATKSREDVPPVNTENAAAVEKDTKAEPAEEVVLEAGSFGDSISCPPSTDWNQVYQPEQSFYSLPENGMLSIEADTNDSRQDPQLADPAIAFVHMPKDPGTPHDTSVIEPSASVDPDMDWSIEATFGQSVSSESPVASVLGVLVGSVLRDTGIPEESHAMRDANLSLEVDVDAEAAETTDKLAGEATTAVVGKAVGGSADTEEDEEDLEEEARDLFDVQGLYPAQGDDSTSRSGTWFNPPPDAIRDHRRPGFLEGQSHRPSSKLTHSGAGPSRLPVAVLGSIKGRRALGPNVQKSINSLRAASSTSVAPAPTLLAHRTPSSQYRISKPSNPFQPSGLKQPWAQGLHFDSRRGSE